MLDDVDHVTQVYDLGWTAVGKRYLCRKPAGWRHYRWVPDPIAKPVPPVPPVPPVLGPTLAAWALATGNADWSQVFGTDSALLATDEAQTPTLLTGPYGDVTTIDTPPLGPLQITISAAAQALVAAATAALAAPPPGNFTASWDTVMNDQITYGDQIAANAVGDLVELQGGGTSMGVCVFDAQ